MVSAGYTVFGQLDIVEPGHRDVLRHPQSALAKFPQDTDRGEIVDADYRRGLETGVEQFADRPPPAFGTVLVGHRAPLRPGMDAGHRFDESLFALAGRSQQRVMADESQPLVPQRVKMFDQALDALAVLHTDIGDVPFGRADVVEHRRDAAQLQFVMRSGAISETITARPATRRPIIRRTLRTSCSGEYPVWAATTS